MIKYYFKKAIAYGIMIIGIIIGMITQPITENKYGAIRMIIMIVCVFIGIAYSEIIEGRMEKHGRC